jgi:predicted HicB family RNase H-like nuclease
MHGSSRLDKTVINMRFDSALLQRIDAAAKRQGISRTAWVHVAAANALDE